jgi:hypothetical protein
LKSQGLKQSFLPYAGYIIFVKIYITSLFVPYVLKYLVKNDDETIRVFFDALGLKKETWRNVCFC